MKRIFFTALIFTVMVFAANAQHNGYLDSNAVLLEMPEKIQATAALEELRQALQEEGEEMVTILQKEYTQVQRLAAGGCVLKSELDKLYAELKLKEREIELFEQEMKLGLEQRESELLAPILEKLNTAISEVAKENDMQFVFDQGSELILFAEGATDITSMVKTKLGM